LTFIATRPVLVVPVDMRRANGFVSSICGVTDVDPAPLFCTFQAASALPRMLSPPHHVEYGWK
jgi:hypothetical protein